VRKSGRIVAEALDKLTSLAEPGITTLELDRYAEEYILKRGGKPAFKGYRGYPYTLCASVNEQVVHALPSGRKLREGDILSLDLGAIVDGYYGDAAVTVPVGPVSEEARRLLAVTQSLADQDGNKIDPTSVGMPPDFPAEIHTEIVFDAIRSDMTELTITERDWIMGQMAVYSFAGMQQSIDKLAESLK